MKVRYIIFFYIMTAGDNFAHSLRLLLEKKNISNPQSPVQAYRNHTVCMHTRVGSVAFCPEYGVRAAPHSITVGFVLVVL